MAWALFDGIGADDVRAVLSVARRRRFGKNEVIFHEGDPGDTLHLIDKGHVAVRVTTPLGEAATLRILRAGDYFGELAVISPAPRNATIVALDAVETLAIHRDQFEELRRDKRAVDALLMEALIREVRRLSVQLLDALYVPVPKRLARRLCELCDMYESPAGTAIPLTQDDLAELCGTTRPTANKILREFEAQGIVAMSRGRVDVLDRAALARHAR